MTTRPSSASKSWFDRQYHRNGSIMKPDELAKMIDAPPAKLDEKILDRVKGSMLGMAMGDALGAFVEFRPHKFLVDNPVTDLQGGGTWGLAKGQFTDDTSMALCLANSLIARHDFVPYDQLVRYKWWYKNGYMSSTGECFDIGAATRNSLDEFADRQRKFAVKNRILPEEMDELSDPTHLSKFDVYCSKPGVAGNGALMRLAPVPLFFRKYPSEAAAFSGFSGVISHGDRIAFDACRYYGVLIVAAVEGFSKDDLLHKDFYIANTVLFNNIPLHPKIRKIAEGSFKKDGGYNEGIRGKGYILDALEAALWAFWKTKTFEEGALAAVNLGDDTDTTAAIYGQLAGAHYGREQLPPHWLKDLYGKDYIERVSEWLVYEAEQWQPGHTPHPIVPPGEASSPTRYRGTEFEQFADPNLPLRAPSSVPPAGSSTALCNSSSPGGAGTQHHGNQRHSLFRWLSSYSSMSSDSGMDLRSAEDVYEWILSLNKNYKKYAEALKADFVDGFWLRNYVNDESLCEKYKVNNPNHRQHILEQIQKLKQPVPFSP